MVLRFDCGHIICLKCWRRYVTSKMDSEGLLERSDIPFRTLRCPAKGIFYDHHDHYWHA
jgi:hypothetical protein